MPLTALADGAVEAARHSLWVVFLASDDARRARAEHLALLGSAVAGDGVWTLGRMAALLRVIERHDSRAC